jgi:hypothetical protein
VKIYLAARYSRHPELQGYADQLRALGYEVTSRWINGDHQISDAGLAESGEGTVAERERFALEDFEDLTNADICISFTEAPRSSYSRGGRHVEFGIALGLEISCIVVGPRENIFHCLPTIDWYPDWASALQTLS